MTFISQTALTGSTVSKVVTFALPYNASSTTSNLPVLPPVDSYLTIAGNANTKYNVPAQVVGIVNKTQITLDGVTNTTANLTVGMVVSSTSTDAKVPSGVIIQSIDSVSQYTVSPACWIPAGTVINAISVATLDRLSPSVNIACSPIYVQGIPPTVVLTDPTDLTPTPDPARKPGRPATVVATANSDGTINLTIVDPGYGYVDAPLISFTGGSGLVTDTIIAYLSNPNNQTTTSLGGVNTTTMDLLYAADPGTSGSVSSTASTGSYIYVSNTANLSAGNQIVFTTVSGASAFGNLVSTTIYYVLTVDAGNSRITVSSAYGGSAFDPGTSSSGSMTYYSPSFGFGASATVSGTPSKTGTGPYTVTFALGTSISIVTGAYYRVTGNTNPLYNGYWPTTSATGTASTIVLTYQFNPGTWSTATTTKITKESTVGSSSSLGISKPFSLSGSTTLRAGYPSGSAGQITVRISTTRATGHDFLDIGTGGFDTTNYPNQIYGNPSIPASAANQVVEETVGRVFHVSTDENGIFQVGRFFKVDQGTGTVTFSASIALSNLDGLGFKRGVVVSKFDTDTAMTENAPDIVPVQSAIRGFVDLRLGLDYGGNPIPSNQLIGPGYLPLNGTLNMKGNLNIGNNLISNVKMATGVSISDFDGVNRKYVDDSVAGTNSLFKLKDVGVGATGLNVSLFGAQLTLTSVFGTILIGHVVTSSGSYFTGQTVNTVTLDAQTGNTVVTLSASPGTSPPANLSIKFTTLAAGNSLIYDSTSAIWKNVTLPTGDVNITYTRTANAGGSLSSAIQAGVITNTMVSSSAAIVQSKLSMTAAGTRANSTGIAQADLGLVSMDSAYFTANGGWVSIAGSSSTSTGIGYNKIRYVSANTILGNLDPTNAQAIQEVAPGSIVTAGDGIKNASFGTSSGAMTVTYTAASGQTPASQSYSVTSITTARGINSLVKTDGSGSIDVNSLYVNGVETVRVGGTNKNTVFLTTPGGVDFFKAVGATSAQTTTTLTGTLDATLGKLQVKDIATDASDVSVVGNIVGNWKVGANSYWDVTGGVLKSTTLYAGADSTATGTMQGIWKLDDTDPKSVFDATKGTLKSLSLTTGAAGTAGTMTGAWTLYGGLTLNAATSITFGASGVLDITGASAKLKTITLNTGASGTTGTVEGAWSVNSGSTFVATSVQNQANSAITEATTGIVTVPVTADNTIAGKIVLRDANGNFRANKITSDLTGDIYASNGSSRILDNGSDGTDAVFTGYLTRTFTGTTEGDLVYAGMGDNDFFRIRVGATASNAGWAEIATADDGTEPIYVRQYSSTFTVGTIARTATLLDGSGDTTFPGKMTSDSAKITNGITASTGTIDTINVKTLKANNNGEAIVQGTWSLDTGAKFQATYADLAEYYEGDQDYEPGTVLVFGGDKEVTTTTVINDTRMAGVVTTNPAYVMNKEQAGIKVCIALAGRVPCKVVGRVKKGDMLTTSATPGYAVKAMTPTLGAIIGKALEDKDYGEAGVIEIAVGRA
jgi:hypothetical protein